MPSWDLSWEELQTYRGTNPRPDDFEEYWDEALAELERQPAEVMLERAEVQYRSAECFHLWFTGIGGARVHAKILQLVSASWPQPGVLGGEVGVVAADGGQRGFLERPVEPLRSVAALAAATLAGGLVVAGALSGPGGQLLG